eukprot:EG_transcript_42299
MGSAWAKRCLVVAILWAILLADVRIPRGGGPQSDFVRDGSGLTKQQQFVSSPETSDHLIPVRCHATCNGTKLDNKVVYVGRPDRHCHSTCHCTARSCQLYARYRAKAGSSCRGHCGCSCGIDGRGRPLSRGHSHGAAAC